MIHQKTFYILLVCLFCTYGAIGQITVNGIVYDASGDSVLPGVSVVEKGTTNGIATDIEGKYTLKVASAKSILVFSYIGMQTIEILASKANNVYMEIESATMEEVVVTALGIKREKKSLGYAVQDIKADELAQGGSGSIVSAISGKVSGLQINSSGGGIGGSSRIDIRGASSLSGHNDPLWIVDGIPFDNSNRSEGNEFGGKSRAGGAFDLNYDDIESISVLKGPNAAALYGERGGNGVIVVTTKKGKKNNGLGISYSGGITLSRAAYMLDLQNRYGQGSKGIYDKNSENSWGPEMQGRYLETWSGKIVPYIGQKNQLENFTQTGISHRHNISFTGGNKDSSFRLSLGRNDINGIYEGHKIKKLTCDLRADYNINKWLNIDTKISFFNTVGNNRPELGYYGIASYFNHIPPNIRNVDLAPGYSIISGRHIEKLYTTASPDNRNPYFLINQIKNKDTKNRTFGYLSANIKILPGLRAKLKYGMDFYQFSEIGRILYLDVSYPKNSPRYNTMQKNHKEENYELLLSYNKDLNDDFHLSTNLGANKNSIKSISLSATSGKLVSEKTIFLGAGTNIKAVENIVESAVNSAYGSAQLSYQNGIFLDVTARNDWSSTLTSYMDDYDNSYFYPSVSFSGIISQFLEMPQWVSFAKVRTSWAQVGKATSPYMINQGYSLSNGYFDLIKGNISTTKVSEDLKPEISSSWEVGLDIRLFNNRLGLDLTYYNESTRNQIIKVPTAQSAGYSHKLINAGLITNAGIEIMLRTIPIKTYDLEVRLDFNFSKNNGILQELSEGIPEYHFRQDRPGFVSIPGKRMGLIRGTTYERDKNGNILVDDKGIMIKSTDFKILGCIQPDWTGSVNIGVDYKNFFFSTMIDIRKGGEILSASERKAVYTGTALRTDWNDRKDFIYDGVTKSGKKNNVMISAESYWGQVASVDEEFIYDASYVKLKEISLGYKLPKSILKKISNKIIKSARVSFVGTNLLYFHKNTPGTTPDAGAYSSSYAAQAYDFSPVPSTRTYGLSLNVNF